MQVKKEKAIKVACKYWVKDYIMKPKLFLVLTSILIFFLFACERNRTEVANSGSDYSPLELSSEKILPNPASTPGGVNVASVASGSEKPLDPKALYEANCSACHQVSGKGVPAAFPPLDGSKYVTSDNTERMAAIMIYGLQGPITVLGAEYNSVMAPLGQLSDKELAAIATYVRNSWSNKAAPVEASLFKSVREKYGQRSMFNISELGAE